MKGTRIQRVNSELQREISAAIAGALRNKEPLLKGIISVTEVDTAPDLKTAKVYVSVLAPTQEEEKTSLRILRENAGFVRNELAGVLRTRTVPRLTFEEDGSMEYGSRMDALLSALKKDES